MPDNEVVWGFRIAGLSWAAAHANSTGRPSVFNLSLGGGSSTALDDAVTAVCRFAYTPTFNPISNSALHFGLPITHALPLCKFCLARYS